MYAGFKSVMHFDPKDTDEQTATKFMDWARDNKISAVGDKYVPGVEETQEMLRKMRR